MEKVPTKSLLNAYKRQAHTCYGNAIRVADKYYVIETVKAELNIREDIPNKNVAKQARKSETIKS